MKCLNVSNDSKKAIKILGKRQFLYNSTLYLIKATVLANFSAVKRFLDWVPFCLVLKSDSSSSLLLQIHNYSISVAYWSILLCSFLLCAVKSGWLAKQTSQNSQANSIISGPGGLQSTTFLCRFRVYCVLNGFEHTSQLTNILGRAKRDFDVMLLINLFNVFGGAL